MESLWRQQTKGIKPKSANLHTVSQEKTWDVIVIGAGMAGLLSAYYLKEQGKDVLVLEADKIASGQTERTTAKITSQHGVKYNKLIQTVGIEKARIYAQANEAAIREYERLIQSKGIQCQFKRVPAYLYTKQDENVLKQEVKAASLLGIDAIFTKETELPFPVKGAACFQNQAQFSPLEFVKYLSAELNILEHTKVVAIHGNRVIAEYRGGAPDRVNSKDKVSTENGVMIENRVFTADKIIVATHYPLRNVPGFYFLRQHQERSSVIAFAGTTPIHGMYYGIDPEGLSFRQAGDVLLLGGSPHRTGEKHCCETYERILEAASQYLPNAKEVDRWSAQDCMPHDGIPFIGKYSIFTPNLYVVTGFQKWGMTSSMIAAMILQDELCGVKSPYGKLFSPQRCLIKAGIGNFCMDVGMSVKGLLSGLFHTTPARCSHMGCGLVWNPNEKSYDCPCHGSRFDAEGKLLDNPAKKDIH